MKKRLTKKIWSIILAFTLVIMTIPTFQANASTTEVNEYTVTLTGNAKGFLYNETATDKGVIVTYTVKEVTGALDQNGVIGTTKPTEKYPYSGDWGQMIYNEDVAPTMLEEGVTYTITIKKTTEGMNWSYVATTAQGQSHTVNLNKPAGTWNSASQYFGIWLCGTVEAELINVSYVEIDTGKDLGLLCNRDTVSIEKEVEQDSGDVTESIVNIAGSANRFLFNETATDKGVKITYTVKEVTGTLSQNGVIGTVEPRVGYPYGSYGQMIYNENVDPTLLEEGVTYAITIKKTTEGLDWSYVASTAQGGSYTVNLNWPTGTWNNASQYFGLWLCGTVEAELTNVSCVELETGKDLGLASNSNTISFGNDKDSGEVNKYSVELTGHANRFLYNEKATDKGFVLTYTVKEVIGTISQNGIIGTTAPTEKYPYDGWGQMIYNEKVDPTLLEEGVTYAITVEKATGGMNWSYVATTAEGQSHTVNLNWTAGAWNSSIQYFGLWMCGALDAELTNVSCVELETGKDLGLASNSATVIIEMGTQGDDDSNEDSAIETELKNVIVLVGDGMGQTTLQATRDHKGSALYMDSMEYSSMTISSNNIDDELTDSSAGGTALSCGVRTVNGVCALDKDGRTLENMVEFFARAHKKTGLVTTSYLLDATPATFGSHGIRGYSDILAEGFFRNNISVLLGGGTDHFNTSISYKGQNYTLLEYAQSVYGYTFVKDAEELRQTESEKVLGLFGANYMDYESSRSSSQMSIAEMTEKAISLLENEEDGFFLMVEGGNIDHAEHANDLSNTITETIAFDEAVKVALDYMKENPDTLVVVCADHSTGGLVADGTGYRFTTGGHDMSLTPCYASGLGAEYFENLTENAHIAQAIRKATLEVESTGTNPTDDSGKTDNNGTPDNSGKTENNEKPDEIGKVEESKKNESLQNNKTEEDTPGTSDINGGFEWFVLMEMAAVSILAMLCCLYADRRRL